MPLAPCFVLGKPAGLASRALSCSRDGGAILWLPIHATYSFTAVKNQLELASPFQLAVMQVKNIVPFPRAKSLLEMGYAHELVDLGFSQATLHQA